MRKILCFGAAVVMLFALSVASSTAADKPKPEPEEVFKKLDANGDGKLSVDEFVRKRTGDEADKAKAAFAKLDKNSDGYLTLEEFKDRKKK
ncbi:MAG TPA: EF-hand domain-containing protein [Pirellulales bacterium]|jgi:Ca2+-binding EF-hand superfamily protein|nr:EF-hand domain-containing protein [Pirellulales bacterium]